MTNYNERLDEILTKHGAEPGEMTYSLKQAFTSLMKGLVAEAKPEKRTPDYYSDSIDLYSRQCAANSWNKAIDEFEQNLLKALQEKQMSNGDIADSLFIDEDELDNDNTLKALEEV